MLRLRQVPYKILCRIQRDAREGSRDVEASRQASARGSNMGQCCRVHMSRLARGGFLPCVSIEHNDQTLLRCSAMLRDRVMDTSKVCQQSSNSGHRSRTPLTPYPIAKSPDPVQNSLSLFKVSCWLHRHMVGWTPHYKARAMHFSLTRCTRSNHNRVRVLAVQAEQGR
jgi:hypothetical protein